MNRAYLETSLLENIRGLPDDKLAELLDFAAFLKSRLSLPSLQEDSQEKLNFVEFIRQSPLYGVEIEFERDTSTCRDIEL